MTIPTATYVAQAVLAELAGATYTVPDNARPSTWEADLAALAAEKTAAPDDTSMPGPLVWPIANNVSLFAGAMSLTAPAMSDLVTQIYAAAAVLASEA